MDDWLQDRAVAIADGVQSGKFRPIALSTEHWSEEAINELRRDFSRRFNGAEPQTLVRDFNALLAKEAERRGLAIPQIADEEFTPPADPEAKPGSAKPRGSR